MSNSIFDWPASLRRFVRFTTARAEDVNDALDDLSAGLDVVEQSIERSIKVPVGAGEQTLQMPPGLRAGLVLAFDANGDITAYSVGGRWAGNWATATAYAPGDVYRDPATKSLYAVIVIHTSTTVAADLMAGKVSLVVDVSEIEDNRELAQEAADVASGSAAAAAAFANFRGVWSTLSGPLQVASVSHKGKIWHLLEPIADVTAEEPGVSSKWVAYDVVMPLWHMTLPGGPVSSIDSIAVQPNSHAVLNKNVPSFAFLPPAPRLGDYVVITVLNGRFDNLINRRGALIENLAEDVVLDEGNKTYSLRFMSDGTTNSWRFI